MNKLDRGRYGRWFSVLIVLLTVAALGVGAIILHTIEQRLMQRAGNSLTMAAADIAGKLDLILFERYGDIQMIARSPVLHSHDPAAMTEFLHKVQQTYPGYLQLAVTDVRGVIVAATDPSSIGTDRSGESWFQSVRTASRILIQDVQPSLDAAEQLAVMFTAPITDAQHEIHGVVTAQIGLSLLKQIFKPTVQSIELEPETLARIEWQFLTQDGEVIVDSVLLQDEGRVNLKRLGLTSARLIGFSTEPGYIEERHLRRPISVVTGFARTKGIQGFPGLHWGILVRIDRDDILAPIHRFTWKVGLLGGFLFFPILGLLYWTTRRLRVEWAQAHESKTWLFTTLKSIGDAVVATDMNGRMVFMNGVAESLTGWSEEDAKGQPLEAVVHIVNEETRLVVENAVKNVPQEGRMPSPTDPAILIAKDGTERPIEHDSTPMQDATGQMAGVVLIFRDVTESRRAQDAVRRLGQQYQLLLGSAGEGIYGVDLEGNTTLVNPAAAKMIGHEIQDLLGQSMHAILHHTKPDGTPYPEEECRLYAAFREGSIQRVADEVFWRKDGTSFPVEYTSTPMWEYGRIVGAVVTFRDISARKAAEEALRRAEAKYRDMVENAIKGIFQSSPEGWYLSVNPAVTRMLGYDSPADFIARITDIQHQVYVDPSSREEFMRLMNQDNAVHGFEAQVYRKDGGVLWISEHARAVRDDRGVLQYFEGTIEDITDRKQAEDQLMRFHEQLRGLSARMESVREEERIRIARELHDELGLALTVLKMDLVWIGKRISSADAITLRPRLMERIQSTTKRVDDTVRLVQRISSELRPGVLDHLGLAEAIQWQVQEFQTRMDMMSWEVMISPDHIALERDRATALFRIFQEILTNVLRHAQATRVRIHLQEVLGQVVLEVQDNGKGITEAEIASPASLGLMGMRERMLRWGGEVRIDGGRQRGTTVRVQIPKES